MKEEFDLNEIDEFDRLSKTKSNKVQLGGLSNLENLHGQVMGYPPNEQIEAIQLSTDSKKLPQITAPFFQQHFPNLREVVLNSASKLCVLLDQFPQTCNKTNNLMKNVLCIEKIQFSTSSSHQTSIEFVTEEDAKEQNINFLVCASSIKHLTISNCSSQKFFDIANFLSKFENLEVLTLSIPSIAAAPTLLTSPKKEEAPDRFSNSLDQLENKTIALRKLCLSNCGIDHNNFFVQLLNDKQYSSIFANIETIDLSNNKISEIFAPMLTHHKNLKDLKLRNNKIERIKFEENFSEHTRTLTDELNEKEKDDLYVKFDEIFKNFLSNLQREEEALKESKVHPTDEKIKILLDLVSNFMETEVEFRRDLIKTQIEAIDRINDQIQIEFLDLSQNELGKDFFSSLFSHLSWKKLSTLHLSSNNLHVVPFYFWLSPQIVNNITLMNLSKNVSLDFSWSFDQYISQKFEEFPILRKFFEKKKWFPIFNQNGDCILKNAKKIMMEDVCFHFFLLFYFNLRKYFEIILYFLNNQKVSIHKEREVRYIVSGNNSLEYYPKPGNLMELNLEGNQISRFSFQFNFLHFFSHKV